MDLLAAFPSLDCHPPHRYMHSTLTTQILCWWAHLAINMAIKALETPTLLALTGALFKNLTGFRYKGMSHQTCGSTISIAYPVLFQLSRAHPQTILPHFYPVHFQIATLRNFIFRVHIHPPFFHRRMSQLALLTPHPLPFLQRLLFHTLCLCLHLFWLRDVLLMC